MDRRTKILGVVAMMIAAAATATIAACDDGGSNAVKEPTPGVDSGGPTPGVDSGGPTTNEGGTLPDGAPADCVMNPKTHEEIINGCTDAVRIAKNPTLPLLLADGGLPPLP